MLRKVLMIVLVCGVVAACSPYANADVRHRIGVGAHYFQKLGDIDVADIEEDGIGWMLTYQLWPEDYILKFQFDVEQLPQGFAGSPEEVYAPQAYVLAKIWFVYGAVGVGIYYSDGEWADDPFYAFRAGVDLPVLPFIFLDVNLNYRFEQWDTLDGADIDKDTLEVGAAVRLQI